MGKGKPERQKIIRELIKEHKISNQEELAGMLENMGLPVAQATLSRDMKELKITKIHDESGYFYSLSRPAASIKPEASGWDNAWSVESLEFSGSMAVIKTRPGHANMVASVIDSGEMKEIAGTIAGDDTLLLVIREGYSRDDVVKALSKLSGQIGNKRIN